MPMFFPSELDGRATYTTPANKSPISGGVQAPLVFGFEVVAKIYTGACFLFLFSAAFHELVNVTGTYVLLLDQTTAQDNSGNLVANGDLALITLGPTTAAGQVLFLPEEATQPEGIVPTPRSDYHLPEHRRVERRMRGLPFDKGCIAALSSTPGRLTLARGANNTDINGARITARIQVCG